MYCNFHCMPDIICKSVCRDWSKYSLPPGKNTLFPLSESFWSVTELGLGFVETLVTFTSTQIPNVLEEGIMNFPKHNLVPEYQQDSGIGQLCKHKQAQACGHGIQCGCWAIFVCGLARCVGVCLGAVQGTVRWPGQNSGPDWQWKPWEQQQKQLWPWLWKRKEPLDRGSTGPWGGRLACLSTPRSYFGGISVDIHSLAWIPVQEGPMLRQETVSKLLLTAWTHGHCNFKIP